MFLVIISRTGRHTTIAENTDLLITVVAGIIKIFYRSILVSRTSSIIKIIFVNFLIMLKIWTNLQFANDITDYWKLNSSYRNYRSRLFLSVL